MAPVYNMQCLDYLEENPKKVFLEVSAILLKLANNIIEHPENPKYRRLRLANPVVTKTLLRTFGAAECLFEMGFEETSDSLVLSDKKSLHNITLVRDELLKRRQTALEAKPTSLTSKTSKVESAQACTSASMSASTSSIVARNLETISKPAVISRHSSVLQSIRTYSSLVLQYENDSLKKEALACIPLMLLESSAAQKLRDVQVALKTTKEIENVEEPSLQQMLLLELLNWFKNSFFTWVDTLPCFYCSKETVSVRTDHSHQYRVDVFKCKSCLKETLFPRYNDPRKLLETRRGRCGEWANCFTLICRSLGWDARLVLDVTDHVWTEVYLPNFDRWVHCDPCENAFDQPLMYELGWNKQLSYIIAVSCDDVQDVSWRYSTRHADMRKRRTSCKESDLLDLIVELRQNLQQHLSPARKAYLQKRTLKEIVELMKEPVSDGSYSGRQSGSLAWRLARGEVLENQFTGPYVWKPNATEIEKQCIQIQYCSATDTYKRPQGGDVILKGWQNGAFAVESVFRKEEKDWKMLYLTRTEGSEEGHIQWKVDLQGTGLVVDTITVFLNTFTCENGKATSMICGENSCLLIGGSEITTNALSGEESIALKVDLKGGMGSTAWQHAQILRSSVDSSDITLDIKVRLRPRSK